MVKKFYLFALCLVITLLALAGCNGGKKTNLDTSNLNKEGLPIVKEGMTFTYWVPFLKNFTNYKDHEGFKELERRTGIHLEFINPVLGYEKEQFNLMIASRNLPDIIEKSWAADYMGGPDNAIKENIILRLNDLIDEYAPNFKKARTSTKEIEKMTITDEGNIWSFPGIHLKPEPAWFGPIVRKDWLDELGLPIPETIDDWYVMLKELKDKKKVSAPLLLPKNGIDATTFVGAFGIIPDFYLDGNTVKYGVTEPAFKDFLTLMNKWYDEGLIDRDFPARDTKVFDSMCIGGKTGAWMGSYGSNINYYSDVNAGTSYNIVGVPRPTLKKGDELKFRQKLNPVIGYETSITTACKTPEVAVRFLDYNYTEEGSRLFNYGVEGISYEMKAGKPVFKQEIIKYGDKSQDSQELYKYKRHGGPYLREWDAFPSITQKAIDAMEVWSKPNPSGMLPPLSFRSEDEQEYTRIMTDITTYYEEMALKFILGNEPFDKFDDFVKTIKSMEIDKAVQLKQAAYDRYLTR